jgi:hypothetical protein
MGYPRHSARKASSRAPQQKAISGKSTFGSAPSGAPLAHLITVPLLAGSGDAQAAIEILHLAHDRAEVGAPEYHRRSILTGRVAV